jgi:RNA polymerase sigma factor (sigma-70 family)
MESSVSQSLDAVLVQARLGSRSALARLMGSCRPWLRQRVEDRLPRQLARKQDGSDLVQEALHGAVVQFDRFQGVSLGEFRAWMAGILDRRVFRAMRFWGEKRRDRAREEPLSPAWSGRGEPAGSSTSILDRLCLEEDCNRLRQAASWCREDDRAVISLHLFDGRSHDEIAAELGVAPAAIRQRYCRAVRRLGEAIRLLERMDQGGLSSLRQDVIGLHRFQGASPGQIAGRLQVPEDLVARWIAEARSHFQPSSRDGA